MVSMIAKYQICIKYTSIHIAGFNQNGEIVGGLLKPPRADGFLGQLQSHKIHRRRPKNQTHLHDFKFKYKDDIDLHPSGSVVNT